MRTITIPANINVTSDSGDVAALRFVEDILVRVVLAGDKLRDKPALADDLAQKFDGKKPGDDVHLLDEEYETAMAAFLRPFPQGQGDYAPQLFPGILKFFRAWKEAKLTTNPAVNGAVAATADPVAAAQA